MPFHIQGSSLIFTYSFILSFFLPFLIFLLSFFFTLLHVFPPIELSVFLAICFLHPFVLDSNIKQDVTLRFVVFIHNSEETTNSGTG